MAKNRKKKNTIDKTTHYKGVMKRKADDGFRHPQSILPFGSVWEKNMRPTQKPVDLLEYFVITYSNEGDTVLDNKAWIFFMEVICFTNLFIFVW